MLILGNKDNFRSADSRPGYLDNQFSGFNDALGWQSLSSMKVLNLAGVSLKGWLGLSRSFSLLARSFTRSRSVVFLYCWPVVR